MPIAPCRPQTDARLQFGLRPSPVMLRGKQRGCHYEARAVDRAQEHLDGGLHHEVFAMPDMAPSARPRAAAILIGFSNLTINLARNK